MTDAKTLDRYGALTAPATLTLHRLLPGPVDRVWAYLVDSEQRRRWFASGDMAPEVGTTFILTWRNDELTDPPGTRPEGYSAEHSMECRLLAYDPPRQLAHTFGRHGEVSYTLKPQGDAVLLTLVHSRIPDRNTTVGVSAGWHNHLDLLADRLADRAPPPFWDRMVQLRRDYEERTPA